MELLFTRKIGGVDYHIYRPIFLVAIFLLLGIACYGLYENDWSLEPKFYLTCNEPRGCDNQYYQSSSCNGSPFQFTPLCTKERLLYGETYGEKPSFIIANHNTIVTLIIVIALLLNTLIFNKELVQKIRNWKGE